MAATSTSKSFSIDHILYGGVPKMTNSAAVVMTTSTSQQETRAYLTQSYPLAKTHHADTYYPIAWPMQQQQPAWLPASYPLPIDLTWNKRVDAAADWNQFSLAYLNANGNCIFYYHHYYWYFFCWWVRIAFLVRKVACRPVLCVHFLAVCIQAIFCSIEFSIS